MTQFATNAAAVLHEADAYFMQSSFPQAKKLYQSAIDKGISSPDYAKYQIAVIDGLTGDEKSKEQIIFKVIEFGMISDWKIIKAIYGLETIKSVSLNFRSLDDVSLSFLANIFQIDKTNFRCYKLKQSNQNFWNY